MSLPIAVFVSMETPLRNNICQIIGAILQLIVWKEFSTAKARIIDLMMQNETSYYAIMGGA